MRVLGSVFAIILLSGCANNSSETWEDVKTAGRYFQREVDGLLGKDSESRLLASDDEFVGPYEGEYIPLNDTDLKNPYLATDMAVPQPKGIPGQKGVPSIDQFYSPPESIRNLFSRVHFDTDDYILRDQADVQAIVQMATYLKKNPNVYLVIAGHTDERASASYNMALGMRRSNYVRGLLVKNGVDLNRVYTVSRGKEEPLAKGHATQDWKENRRAEFKIYEK
jgi:peptidoglycan-associated lipoprotein